jgi:hypothetical protein
MAELTVEMAEELAGQFFGQGEVGDMAREHSREEIIAFLGENIRQIQAEVVGMSAEQLAYRLPGSPEGPDESGDEAHFDTSQIVTHMAAGTAFHWWNITRALRHERPPMPRPPHGAGVTGKKKSGMGAGGWSGFSGQELSVLLGETVDGFLGYVNQLTDEDFSAGTSSYGLFRNMTPHDWLFLVAMHSAMHLAQIRHMKEQPDYPRG